jgi:hypothetical protein
MKKNRCIVLCLMAVVLLGAPLFGQTGESLADKVNLSLEFNASVVSANSEGVVDSMADSGFNEDESKIGVGYEGEWWGGTASFKFANEALRILNNELGERFAGSPFSIDELYAWVKPFGEHFKFTGGIFENTDGVTDYTDDIDDFPMGFFMWGDVRDPFAEDGHPFREPGENSNVALVNGFLAETTFGPITAQLLLAPNYSDESGSAMMSELVSQVAGSQVVLDAEARFFRIGGRIIGNIEGIGTVSALFKTFQWPVPIMSAAEQTPYPGTVANFHTFGAYFDITAIEKLGISLGYTGFLPYCDAEDVDNILWHGIDLRSTWTGIDRLSLSTHNNISFAKGAKNDWIKIIPSDDSSYFTLYNAIGATKELTERFSINAEIANVLSVTDNGNAGKIEFDEFVAGAKLITHITENAEFDVGLSVSVAKTTTSGNYGEADETVTTFSIPVGIKVNF